MRREDLRTLLTALGLADQSSNPNRISAVEAWRTSQEALRADAGNNLLSVHDVVQLTSDAAKMGPIVSIDASAGSLTVKFDGESTTTTVPLASVQRWTRDGTTGQQPDPKRQRTSPVAALATNGSSVEALLDEAIDCVATKQQRVPTNRWRTTRHYRHGHWHIGAPGLMTKHRRLSTPLHVTSLQSAPRHTAWSGQKTATAVSGLRGATATTSPHPDLPSALVQAAGSQKTNTSAIWLRSSSLQRPLLPLHCRMTAHSAHPLTVPPLSPTTTPPLRPQIPSQTPVTTPQVPTRGNHCSRRSRPPSQRTHTSDGSWVDCSKIHLRWSAVT